MSDVDAVAEAIRDVDPFKMHHNQQKNRYLEDYRHMAQAAIDALGLTEEWGATCHDWKGGRMVRQSLSEAVADRECELGRERGWADSIRPEEMWIESRLVSPWVRADE